ncbi:peptide chain release factor 2, partial [Dysosmobacter sp. Sow4_B12]
ARRRRVGCASNIDGVMDGDLDGFLNAYLTQLATGELKK